MGLSIDGIAPSYIVSNSSGAFMIAWFRRFITEIRSIKEVRLEYGIVYTGLREYRTGGTVFGAVYPSLEQAQLAVLPYGAAGAILGVTVSSLNQVGQALSPTGSPHRTL